MEVESIEDKDFRLKGRYGKIYRLEVQVSDDDTAIAYLKEPTRVTLSAVFAKINTDPLLANEILLKGTIISEESDKRIIEDDAVFLSAIASLDGMITLKKSSLTKL